LGNLHLVVASRPERDISNVFEGLANVRSVDMTEEASNHDIAIYLEQHISEEHWDKETREEVKTALMNHAQGMFRWVALQLTELKECSNHHSVMEQLKILPKGLYETYDQILLKVNNLGNRMDTKIFLQWLCFSARSMSLEEISEVVVVNFESENGPEYTPKRRYFNKRDVLKNCVGFITESEGKIKLAHFSIKEYLMSEDLLRGAASFFHFTAELSHSLIAQTCLVYLLQFDRFNSLNLKVMRSFLLAEYAANYWIFHAHQGGIEKSEASWMFRLTVKLFTPSSAQFRNWVKIHVL